MRTILLRAAVWVILLAVPAAAQEGPPDITEWCTKCKLAEREGCRKPCAPEQGVKYFVCLDECSLRRCEMACTPIEEDPQARAEREEKERRKLCNTCRRQSRDICKSECSDQNGRKRARCKKNCVIRRCKDACTSEPEEVVSGVEAGKEAAGTEPREIIEDPAEDGEIDADVKGLFQ